MQVIKRDGSKEELEKRKIAQCVERACKNLEDVDASLIADEAYQQIYDGIKTEDIDRATILAARARIAEEPNYSFVAARLLLHDIYREVFGKHVDGRSLAKNYRDAFKENLVKLVEAKRLCPSLLTKFDLDKLSDELEPERDLLFKYLGVQTLYDRYLLHVDKIRLEAPQLFWMRVAMGISLNEPNPTEFATKVYHLISSFKYCPATPTLFNSGTLRPQLSSCYLSTMEDSIDGIYGCVHQQARLCKFAGGLGIDITPLRGNGSRIEGTNGESQGYIPWAKQFNSLVCAVNQGGKRKGAAALYSEVWHIDYPDFLDLRKNTGDERRRCHDLNTASWICDFFMKTVENDGDWYLFDPAECPDLHELHNEEFEKRYLQYIKLAKKGKVKYFGVLKAKDLWRKMLTALKETGHPWMTFKDSANRRYANQHAGVVHSSNLCTEIFEHTKPTKYDSEGEVKEVGETAVCNLASVNIAAHTNELGEVDWDSLRETVRVAVQGLDNVIDLNFYPTKEALVSNARYRPVGLGLMGWADTLHLKGFAFDSPFASSFAYDLQEFISYHAIKRSIELAAERGRYPRYEGSLWSKQIVPSDTDIYEAECELNWVSLREELKEHGIRNGLLQAIAPTATISYIVGCSQSIEPNFSVLYVYSTLSGEFTLINEHFVRETKKLGLWNPELVKQIRKNDGDISSLDLPPDLKNRFKTAFDVDQLKLIDVAAARQRWIDQGQSLNLYYSGNSMKELSNIYFHAWKLNLKSTYYLHTKAASRIEKSVTTEAAACKLGEACESCQ